MSETWKKNMFFFFSLCVVLISLDFSYFSIRGMKKNFYASFFRNISKTHEIIFIKKNLAKRHGFALQKFTNE